MSFEEVRGQQEAAAFVRNAVKRNRLSHAYIFAGPAGCGRSLLAKNFAKALNCFAFDSEPCERCISCRKINSDTHPDVRWVQRSGESMQIKIQQMRHLECQIALKPFEGRYKVWIIKDAEYMTQEAANSFLKTLEEPPPYSLFILTVERPKDLLPTIMSRCQIIRLKPLDIEALTSILVNEHGYDRQDAEVVARYAEGKLGKALQFDRDAIEWKNSVIEELSDDECAQNYTGADRAELSQKLCVLIGWYRDALLYKTTADTGLLINRDRIEDVVDIASAHTTEALLRMFENVIRAKQQIESNVNPKLALSNMDRGVYRCTK